MKPSNKCLNLIKEFEGFKSKPYKCSAGKYTIGFGTTIYPNGIRVTGRDGEITKDQATSYLSQVVDLLSRELVKLIKVELDQNKFDAIVSLVYNIGVGNFKSSTLLKKINDKEPKHELALEFDKWIYVDKKISQGLVNRRKKEKELFLL